jgi:mRNA-degrading endonuclease toxin of MazEF toxin-antitoxin module
MNRGDVVLVRFPHPSGPRGKKRPAVIVQSDTYFSKVSTLRRAKSNRAPSACSRAESAPHIDVQSHFLPRHCRHRSFILKLDQAAAIR